MFIRRKHVYLNDAPGDAGGAPAPADPPAAAPPPSTPGLIADALKAGTPPPADPNAPPADPKARPDWALEQHWDAKTGELKYDAVTKSYLDTRKELEAIKKAQKEGADKPPESAAKYTVTLPEGAPEGILAADDPVMTAFRESAHKAGLSQAQFQQVFTDVLGSMTQNLPPPVSVEEEKAKLGENADAVVSTVVTWAQKLVTDGVWSQDEFNEIAIMGSTADGIRALNKLRTMTGEAPIPVGAKSMDSLPSKEELYARVNDPRYQTDPAYRQKVTEQFEQVFGNDPAGSSQAGLGMVGAGQRRSG